MSDQRLRHISFVAIGLVSATSLVFVMSTRVGAQIEGTMPGFVRLQSATPGLQQSGNSNVSGTVIAGQFQGGGAGLSNLNASNILAGSLPDARLSANVALLNLSQTFSAAKTFSATPSFTNAAAPFIVTNPTKIGNLNADLLDNQTGAFYQDAANLTGLVSDARLSSNVALLTTNQTITGQKVFSQFPAFTNATIPFSVTSTNLVGNLNAQYLNGRGEAYFINASNLTLGTLSDGRLSTNVATLAGAQTFTGQKTFSSGIKLPTGAQAGHVLTSDATGNASWQPGGGGASGPADGDLAGTYPNPIVDGLQNRPVSSAAPTPEQVLAWNGTTWAPADDGIKLPFVDTGTQDGLGLLGIRNTSAVTGSAGLSGSSLAASGVTYGVYGDAQSPNGHGVHGHATAVTGSSYGGYFQSDSTQGTGVYGMVSASAGRGVHGRATATTGQTFGGLFESSSTEGNGVFASATSGSGVTYGGRFLNSSSQGYGIYGSASAFTGQTYGVWAESDSIAGRGVYGRAHAGSGTTYGVIGSVVSPNGYAGYFSGGQGLYADQASAGVKAFLIDHPLDPLNKYLRHSSVESPDMMNVYNGNVTTDKNGEAWVTLPDYFEALNRDFRYQLTVLDAADTDGFCMVKVARKIQANRFKIKTSVPRVEVSWQVTGVRHDPAANHFRIQVERDKPESQRGKYLMPEAYGKPKEMGIHYFEPSKRPTTGKGP